MSDDIILRLATADDAAACLALYAPYITDTAITYECSVPSLEEFRGRITSTLAHYPWIVAERDGRIVGYAYAGRFRVRAAFDWSVEMSIYVDRAQRHGGVGRALYDRLEALLTKMGIVNLYAYIVYPRVEDEYANYNSFNFHVHMGYEPVGVFEDVANKFGRWYGRSRP